MAFQKITGQRSSGHNDYGIAGKQGYVYITGTSPTSDSVYVHRFSDMALIRTLSGYLPTRSVMVWRNSLIMLPVNASASPSSSAYVFDITDPSNPVYTGQKSFPSNATSVEGLLTTNSPQGFGLVSNDSTRLIGKLIPSASDQQTGVYTGGGAVTWSSSAVSGTWANAYNGQSGVWDVTDGTVIFNNWSGSYGTLVAKVSWDTVRVTSMATDIDLGIGRTIIGMGGDPYDRRWYAVYHGSTSATFYYGTADNFSYATPPSLPTSISPSSNKVKVGDEITITCSEVSVPSQPSGVSLDKNVVYYDIDLWNGSKWVEGVRGSETNIVKYTIPPMTDTTSAKLRVRTYVVLSGGSIYSGFSDANWKESSTFTIYNNTVPTISSNLTISVGSGKTIEPLEKVNVQFTLGTDVDLEDTLTGSIDYWNGSDWSQIGTRLKPVDGKVTLEHIIPAKAVTGAKYQVATYDGKDYGPVLESHTFNVSNPDPSRKLPNMLELDGVDDYMELPHTPEASITGSNVTFEMLFQSTQPPKSGTSALLFGKKDSMWFEIRDNGSVDFFVTTTSGVKGVGTGQSVTDGTMKQLSATYDGTTIRIYINGELVNSIAHTGTIVDNDEHYTAGKPVNVESENPYNSQAVAGKVGNFRVFSTTRTEQEIKDYTLKEVPKETPGLTLSPQFDGETGKIVCSKTGTAGVISGGAKWAYSFVPLTGVILPSSIKANTKSNLDYLRLKVSEFRKANGLPTVSWTDATIIKSITPIKAVHLNELNQSIRDTYSLTGQVITDSQVKEVIEETVISKDSRYRINDMGTRLNAIVRALTNK